MQALVRAKKAGDFALSWTNAAGESVDVALRKRAQPFPGPAEGPATSDDNLLRARFAGKKGIRERFEKKASCMRDAGRMLQRVLPSVSLSACERSGAHATDFQLFTFPWGNPRDADPSPKARSDRLGGFCPRSW